VLTPILATEDPYRTAAIFCRAGWQLEFETPPDSGDPLACVSLAGSKVLLGTAEPQFLADEARAVRGALGADSPPDDLVEITSVTSSRLHVSRILRHSPSEGMLLFVDLERGKSNLGLAALRVSQLAPAVLA